MKKHYPNSNLVLKGNEEKYVLDAVRSNWISSIGEYVNQFEKRFAEYLGSKYAVSVSNGTCALHLALEVLGIGSGDEVIVPSLTFAATANAVIHAGADPVFVDCYSNNWNMDPSQIEQVISPKTKAIIPVHLFGHSCDMDAIMKIALKYNLYVIEDAAEAHGATFQNKKVGAIADIGCFSFYANKIITTGEGGICVTENEHWNNQMRILRDHGMNRKKKYWQDAVGYNYRMTNLNAAIGVAQLEQIEVFLKKRKMLADLYVRLLSDVEEIEFFPKVTFGCPVDWLFCIFFKHNTVDYRNRILESLSQQGVDARPIFYPLHDMPVYSNYRHLGDLNNSHKLSASGLCLPLYPLLEEEDIIDIVNILKATILADSR